MHFFEGFGTPFLSKKVHFVEAKWPIAPPSHKRDKSVTLVLHEDNMNSLKGRDTIPDCSGILENCQILARKKPEAVKMEELPLFSRIAGFWLGRSPKQSKWRNCCNVQGNAVYYTLLATTLRPTVPKAYRLQRRRPRRERIRTIQTRHNK